MRTVLREKWWVLTLRGLLAVLIGILALIWPGLGLLALLVLFGAYMLLDGVMAIWMARERHRMGKTWGLALVDGLLGIGLAVVVVIWPRPAAVALVLVVAIWAILTGLAQTVDAYQARHDLDHPWLFVTGGLLSLLLGILLLASPSAGLVALVWLLALYAILFGVLVAGIGLSLRGRRLRE